MVYESGFTSRRTYSSRPVVTSYAVSYPTVTRVSRIYKASYPIYSASSYTRGYRVISSPVRVITSPARVITRVIRSPSPVRVTRATTTRVITSPERLVPYTYTTPTIYISSYTPLTNYSSYTPYVPSYISRYVLPPTPSNYVSSSPTYLYSSLVSRIYSRSLTPVRAITSSVCRTPSYLRRISPGYGERALKNYLTTEPFATFRAETGRIRNRAQSLMRDLHTPVVRPVRSMTPFPVTGFEPATDVAFDAYVSRITNPVRHIAKEIHRMSMYPEPAHKYVDHDLDPYRPTRKFSVPRLLENPVDDELREKQRLRQERLMTVNEEVLSLSKIDKNNTQRDDDTKQRKKRILKEEAERKDQDDAQRKSKEDAAEWAEEAARLAEEKIKHQEEEMKRLTEIQNQSEEAHKAALVAEKRILKEEAERKDQGDDERKSKEDAARSAEEAARLTEEKIKLQEKEIKRVTEIQNQSGEAPKAALVAEKGALGEEQERPTAEEAQNYVEDEIKLTEETRLAVEYILAEDARVAEEAKLEAETGRKFENAARMAEEQRIREEEICRLAEIEKQAEEEREADLARQAAELADIARREVEIAAQVLHSIQKTEQIETAAKIEETQFEIPIDFEVHQEYEPTIDVNLSCGDTEITGSSTEEE